MHGYLICGKTVNVIQYYLLLVKSSRKISHTWISEIMYSRYIQDCQPVFYWCVMTVYHFGNFETFWFPETIGAKYFSCKYSCTLYLLLVNGQFWIWWTTTFIIYKRAENAYSNHSNIKNLDLRTYASDHCNNLGWWCLISNFGLTLAELK